MTEQDSISFKRFGQFLYNMIQIEKSVSALQAENKKLRQSVSELQDAMAKQSGQLSELRDFVKDAHHDKIERIAEQAALGAVGQIVKVLDQKNSQQDDGFLNITETD